jgi:Zn-dependent alcohol dehydrogenase
MTVEEAGAYPIPLPCVLGHEGAGVISAVAPGVHDLAVGDRVAMSYAGHPVRLIRRRPAVTSTVGC